MKSTRLVNLPNALTLVRILLVPVFLCLYYGRPDAPWIALIVFVLAGITDIADGYLARKSGQITWFGKLFDPLADKLMSISVLYCLADAGRIGWWVLWVFLLKECYLVAGASVLFSKNYVVKSDYFGKTATFSFILSTCLLLPWHGQEWLAKLGSGLLYLSLLLALGALVHYTLLAVKKRSEFKAR